MKIKANKLSIQKQIQIAKYKLQNPKIPVTAIAEQFNITYDQAINAIAKNKRGELKIGRVRTPKVDYKIDPNENLLKKNYDKALASLDQSTHLDVLERISAIDKLTTISKTIQSMELQNHLKRLDADVIACIVRRFKPDATNEEIIKMYHEELEKLRGGK